MAMKTPVLHIESANASFIRTQGECILADTTANTLRVLNAVVVVTHVSIKHVA